MKRSNFIKSLLAVPAIAKIMAEEVGIKPITELPPGFREKYPLTPDEAFKNSPGGDWHIDTDNDEFFIVEADQWRHMTCEEVHKTLRELRP